MSSETCFVWQRMLENGFNGFPRASRSARVRGSTGKKFGSGQNRSFEILASVAGTLLDKSTDTNGASYVKDRYYCDFDGNISSRKCDEDDEVDANLNRLRMIDSSDDHSCFSGANEGKLEDEMDRNRSIKEEEIDIVTGLSGDQKMFEAKPTQLDGKIEEIYDDKRICHTHETSQKIFPFKKRKFFNHDTLFTSDKGFNRKDTFNSPENRKPCVASQQLIPNSKECNVKLSIKSFKVPEFFIDISTNATVGSLKRTVMEAVTSILGDGLHVGILMQGKRVRDDNKTLIQSGISQDDKSHNLGFVLEPKQHSRSTISSSFKNETLLARSRSHGLTRRCTSLASQQGASKASLSCIESDLSEGDENLADTSSNKTNHNDSKSLVPVPKIGMKALAVVPLHCKSGHHEYGQRRIRRPFSVTEVEALVRAVEKLGTGRWRDVKFHAFDNAKHRTYVDLKDKWKTLVHTARISAQQRRGEPVPQELLDRVLAAQAYWSHRQAKQHAMLTI